MKPTDPEYWGVQTRDIEGNVRNIIDIRLDLWREYIRFALATHTPSYRYPPVQAELDSLDDLIRNIDKEIKNETI
jgi:hypothetical protein